jgi:hypothetical protein
MIGELQRVTGKIIEIISTQGESSQGISKELIDDLKAFIYQLLETIESTENEQKQMIELLTNNRDQINTLANLFDSNSVFQPEKDRKLKESVYKLTSQIQHQFRL